MSYWSSVGGILTALLAAVAGFVDYFTMARFSRAAGMASAHMSINLMIVGLFVVAALLLRRVDPVTSAGFRHRLRAAPDRTRRAADLGLAGRRDGLPAPPGRHRSGGRNGRAAHDHGTHGRGEEPSRRRFGA
jgi:hypothetical protein